MQKITAMSEKSSFEFMLLFMNQEVDTRRRSTDISILLRACRM
jgi:hypothetical protein